MKSKYKNLFIAVILLFFTAILNLVFTEVFGPQEIEVKYTYKLGANEHKEQEPKNETNEGKFYLEAIEGSAGAVVGEFISYEEVGTHYVFHFKNIRNIYGEINEEIIDFFVFKSSFPDDIPRTYKPGKFNKGERYILFLDKRDSVALSQPMYQSYAYAYIPLDNLKNSSYSRGEINFPKDVNESSVIRYFRKLAEKRGYNINSDGSKVYCPEIFRNESLETVIKESDIVLIIKPTEYQVNRTRIQQDAKYTAELIEGLKGIEKIKIRDNSLVYIYGHRDALEVGKTYIVALSGSFGEVPERQLEISALNGIIPIEDTETVNKVYKWLNIK